MYKSVECFSDYADVNELKVLDNNLIALITKVHGIEIFSHEECSLQLSINNVKENLHIHSRSAAFSPNGEFVAFCLKTDIYILHMPSRILIKTIYCDNEEVELLSFDLESKYLIAATASGRVLQYRYDGTSLVARLCSFKKLNSKEILLRSFVSSFAFFKNRLACASENGEIIVIDLHSRVKKANISNSKSRVNALCFLDEERLISGTMDGKLHINTLEYKNISKEIVTGFMQISQILCMPHKNYVMVSGNTNYVSIYDVKKYKIVHTKYRKFEHKIEKIALVNSDTLIVVLQNATVHKILLPSTQKLKLLLETNSLEEAFILCEDDCMLQDSQEYNELEACYNKLYMQAVSALILRQINVARQCMDNFKNISSKKEEIAMLFKAYENYSKLQTLYIDKKYSLAYALCAQFRALEHTFEYKKMEEVWKKAYRTAQRQILLGKEQSAKTSLSEFRAIPAKRAVILLILNHNQKFMEFLRAIEAKNYQKVNEIAKANNSFTQVPSYKSLENEIEAELICIQNYINLGDIALANEKLAKFLELPKFSSQFTKLSNASQNMQKLQNAYEKNDFQSCYETLDAYHELGSSQLGLLLEKHWSKLMQICEDYALKGSIKEIKTTLRELIHLATRREKIGDLLRVSFHTKIKILQEEKNFKKAENLIYSYIDIFGMDTEIHSLMRLYETLCKTKLAISQNSRQSRDNWINSAIIAEPSLP